jgi:hypothetical protein
MGMTRLPELIIGYDESYFPATAVCSACGETMPNSGPLFPTSQENIAWFRAQFDEHMRQWHSAEEKDQTLTSIVT